MSCSASRPFSEFVRVVGRLNECDGPKEARPERARGSRRRLARLVLNDGDRPERDQGAQANG